VGVKFGSARRNLYAVAEMTGNVKSGDGEAAAISAYSEKRLCCLHGQWREDRRPLTYEILSLLAEHGDIRKRNAVFLWLALTW
jgi:hypothetical protein